MSKFVELLVLKRTVYFWTKMLVTETKLVVPKTWPLLYEAHTALAGDSYTSKQATTTCIIISSLSLSHPRPVPLRNAVTQTQKWPKWSQQLLFGRKFHTAGSLLVTHSSRPWVALNPGPQHTRFVVWTEGTGRGDTLPPQGASPNTSDDITRR